MLNLKFCQGCSTQSNTIKSIPAKPRFPSSTPPGGHLLFPFKLFVVWVWNLHHLQSGPPTCHIPGTEQKGWTVWYPHPEQPGRSPCEKPASGQLRKGWSSSWCGGIPGTTEDSKKLRRDLDATPGPKDIEDNWDRQATWWVERTKYLKLETANQLLKIRVPSRKEIRPYGKQTCWFFLGDSQLLCWITEGTRKLHDIKPTGLHLPKSPTTRATFCPPALPIGLGPQSNSPHDFNDSHPGIFIQWSKGRSTCLEDHPTWQVNTEHGRPLFSCSDPERREVRSHNGYVAMLVTLPANMCIQPLGCGSRHQVERYSEFKNIQI